MWARLKKVFRVLECKTNKTKNECAEPGQPTSQPTVVSWSQLSSAEKKHRGKEKESKAVPQAITLNALLIMLQQKQQQQLWHIMRFPSLYLELNRER